MFQLRCTVRGCQRTLSDQAGGLTCAAGHHFDRAKQGYWNLLQPQDRKSKDPGDSQDAVLARQRWLERGHASGLIETLKPWLSVEVPVTSSSLRTMDLGCGEGTFGQALFADEPNGFCGIDLSKRAIKLAARRWPEATWVLANADRVLPANDGSVHCVVSWFGRRPGTEICRVLCDDGICVVAVPGEDDLIELRESVQQTGRRRSRWEAIATEMTHAGLIFVQHQVWRHRVELDPDAIADALAMTYRAVRHAQQERAKALETTNTTLSADLLLFRRPPRD